MGSDPNLPGIEKPPVKTRVVVAMSGGVDSSVTAALLVEAGYEVVGVTLQLYDHGEASHKSGACCSGEDIGDARTVASRLGIAHYVLNYEERFHNEVIERFADSYVRGETPNPCIECNRTVKFRDLLKTAHDLGADTLATGHYAQRLTGKSGVELHRARDTVRDQSYFLFATTAKQLKSLLFPLGSFTKDETREHARRLGLVVAEKHDSQDICFVPGGDYTEVVRRLRADAYAPGEVVHIDGRVLGRHEGVVNFTVGQRRGLGLGGGAPLYVVRIDPDERRIIVGPEAALAGDRLALREVNWLGDKPLPATGVRLSVKLRSTQAAVPATVYGTERGGARVVLDTPALAISPGQACVFYDADRVLGGGWIMRDIAKADIVENSGNPLSGNLICK
jgi:tRNA-specific 2-thiouridylase